jgi:hypothetical protein
MIEALTDCGYSFIPCFINKRFMEGGMKIFKHLFVICGLLVAPLSWAYTSYDVHVSDREGPRVHGHEGPHWKVHKVHHPRHRDRVTYEWREFYSGPLPTGAMFAGDFEGRPTYICQAPFRDGIHPGRLAGDRCVITYGGEVIPRNRFKILIDRGYQWRWTRAGDIPPNAVVGGYEKGRPLFVCRAPLRGMHPGKVIAGACNIAFRGEEVTRPTFQVLVAPEVYGDEEQY